MLSDLFYSQIDYHIQGMVKIGDQSLAWPRQLNIHCVRAFLKDHFHNHSDSIHQHASIWHQFIGTVFLSEHLAQVVLLQLSYETLQIIRIL